MLEIGYALSSEEHRPGDLVRFAVGAEQSGFGFALISDHFHPWTDAQGHSPFVWATLGGIAQATERLRVGTGVTCPTFRMPPALVAHDHRLVGWGTLHGPDAFLEAFRAMFVLAPNARFRTDHLRATKGDLIVFHSRLLHMSTDNQGRESRIALSLHYATAGTTDRTAEVFGQSPYNYWLPAYRTP